MYDKVAELYRALGDPVRLRILSLLQVREACVCELVELLPVSQPAVSQHLRKLRQVGLLKERRHKYWTYYGIADHLAPEIEGILATLPRDPAAEAWLAAHNVEESCTSP